MHMTKLAALVAAAAISLTAVACDGDQDEEVVTPVPSEAATSMPAAGAAESTAADAATEMPAATEVPVATVVPGESTQAPADS